MKKWIVRIVIGVIVLGIIAIAAIFFFLNSIVKTGVETVGPKLTKVNITLGSAKLSPFSGSGELSDLVIGNPEGFKTPTAIKIGDVKLSVNVHSLLTDVIEVDEINIQAPEITYELGLGGSNLGKILDNLSSQAANEPKQPGKPEKAAGKKNIYIKNVIVNGGKINVSTIGLGGNSVPVLLPTLHLQNIGTQDKGVTMAEASKQILEAVLTNVTKVAGTSATGIGAGIKQGTNKVIEGIKGIFK